MFKHNIQGTMKILFPPAALFAYFVYMAFGTVSSINRIRDLNKIYTHQLEQADKILKGATP